VPSISSFALTPWPVITGGITDMLKVGELPPLAKNACLIWSARWNARTVSGENPAPTSLSWRHFHSGRDLSM
jgi:hypothetical protein